MDSVLTLVNPSPPTEFVFDRDSILDAKIYINSRPAYLIATTENIGGSRTDIQDLRTQEVVVSIVRKSLTSDRISFHTSFSEHSGGGNAAGNGGKTMKVKDWMKSSKADDGYPAHSIETEYGTFMWKIDRVHRLALFRNGHADYPLARMRAATRDSPLVLVIENEVLGFLDRIIASWLILERKMRVDEGKYRRADKVAQQSAGYAMMMNAGAAGHV